MTPDDLLAFEADIAAEFAAGRIASPVHLAGGNEQWLISYFRNQVSSQDWVLSQWRSHYHCLLKGVPPQEVKQAIVEGRSIALCFPAYRIVSSAIVGGICPIATGLGMSIKRRNGPERVHVFVGDMTATTGIYHECVKYCAGHDLPVSFVIEDNGVSVCTRTDEVWGTARRVPDETRYYYWLTRPHVGVGKYVRF